MRWLLASALSFCFTLAVVGPGSALQAVQPDLLVTSDDGALWLMRDGQRHALAPQVVGADDLARWPEASPFGSLIPPVIASPSPPDGVSATTTPASPDAQATWHRAGRWQGNGDKNTEPFVIQGAQWRISYTVRDPHSNTPRVCITVRTTEMAHVDGGCYRQDDVTYVYRRGTFYLDITSADQWTVTVEDYY